MARFSATNSTMATLVRSPKTLRINILDADTFVLNATAQSTVSATGRDTIVDFSHADGDKIDLRPIDANTTAAVDQAFNFIGSSAFRHHAGELRYVALGASIVVSGDVNG